MLLLPAPWSSQNAMKTAVTAPHTGAPTMSRARLSRSDTFLPPTARHGRARQPPRTQTIAAWYMRQNDDRLPRVGG